MSKKQEYYRLTQRMPPSPLLVQAFLLLASRKTALDLGCGAGRDTKWLLAQGLEVTAVDHDAEALAYLRNLQHPRLHVLQAAFEDVMLTSYDLVHAAWSLPFIQSERFADVFPRIQQAVKPGGLLTGQLFGSRDSWNVAGTAITFVTREAVQTWFADWTILTLQEEEYDGTTALGIGNIHSINEQL